MTRGEPVRSGCAAEHGVETSGGVAGHVGNRGEPSASEPSAIAVQVEAQASNCQSAAREPTVSVLEVAAGMIDHVF